MSLQHAGPPMEALTGTDRGMDASVRVDLNAALSREHARALRYGESFSVILCDLDGFRDLNDRYGRPVGDWVLHEVERLLRREVRSLDTVGRWRADEFLVVAPHTDARQALALAERLHPIVTSIPLPDGALLTSSSGVAAWRRGEKVPVVLARADGACYRAKLQGRTRVEMTRPARAPHDTTAREVTSRIVA